MTVLLSLLLVIMILLGLLVIYVIYCLAHDFSKDLEDENLTKTEIVWKKKQLQIGQIKMT